MAPAGGALGLADLESGRQGLCVATATKSQENDCLEVGRH
jgi:hypothetical protein